MIPLRAAAWRLRLATSGRTLEHFRTMRRLAAAPRSAVEDYQRGRLQTLLLHAYEKVPYYREVLDEAGVVARGRLNLDNFSRLPLLDKSIIRSRFDDLTASDMAARRAKVNTSGGSTGEPVKFVQDREAHEWKLATKLLFDSWTGYRPGEPVALLWGATRDLQESGWRTRLGTALRSELRLNAYVMSNEISDDYIAQLNSFRPSLILAYAQSIFNLAVHAEKTSQKLFSPTAIMTSATTLEDDMRSTIERVFGAPVFNRYGSREVSDVACDFGDGLGLVVSPATHLVEVLSEDGQPVRPGEPGEIVVTLLSNLAMPLLRFRIGDMAIQGETGLGQISWPRLAKVLGRTTDIFYTADGKHVYGGYFTRHFYGKEWVSQFQVEQVAYNRLNVRIVPSRPLSEEYLLAQKQELREAFREIMGSACAIHFDVVDSIPVGPTGKRRYTISHVGPPA